jgi:hypothetical protein
MNLKSEYLFIIKAGGIIMDSSSALADIQNKQNMTI